MTYIGGVMFLCKHTILLTYMCVCVHACAHARAHPGWHSSSNGWHCEAFAEILSLPHIHEACSAIQTVIRFSYRSLMAVNSVAQLLPPRQTMQLLPQQLLELAGYALITYSTVGSV
jgi:hypothetical protein